MKLRKTSVLFLLIAMCLFFVIICTSCSSNHLVNNGGEIVDNGGEVVNNGGEAVNNGGEAANNEDEADNNEGEKNVIDLSGLTKLSINLSDAKGLCIRKQKDIMPLSANTDNSSRLLTCDFPSRLSSEVIVATVQSDTDEQEYRLVKSNGTSENEIVFVNNTNSDVEVNGIIVKNGDIITQDQIGAKINKLYVDNYNHVTYIQLCISETDIRPSALEYDEKGLSEYDCTDYYTDETHKTFLIDNSTGKIYLLNDFRIARINDGLVQNDDGLIFEIKIKENRIQYLSLFENPGINVIAFFKDKYNNNYIQNDRIQEKDSETNTVFFRKNYYQSTNGEVIYINSSLSHKNSAFEIDYYLEATEIHKIVENLECADITSEDIFDFDNIRIAGEYGDSYVVLSHIINGNVYFYAHSTFSDAFIARINIDSKDYKEICFTARGKDSRNYGMAMPLDCNTILFFDNSKGNNGSLYYLDFDFDKEYDVYFDFAWEHDSNCLARGATNIAFSVDYTNCKLLKKNCVWDYKFLTNEESRWNYFSVDTAKSKQAYIAVAEYLYGEKTVVLKTVEDFNAAKRVIYSFQPINLPENFSDK